MSRSLAGCLLLGLAILASACGGVAAGASAGNGAPTDAGPDDHAAAPPADADVGPDGAACSDPDWPGYHVCCGRPGEMPGANCVSAALLSQPCAGEGQSADLKSYIRCCDGLSPIVPAEVIAEPSGDAGMCKFPFELDTTRVCTKCGDGTCGLGENVCSCPQDCP